MKPESKAMWLTVMGYMLCILPALAALLEYFPRWFSGRDSRQVMPAVGLLMILLCCLPLQKALRSALSTPSAWKVWTVLALCFGLMKQLADGMFAVACIASVSSAAGAVFFRLADRIKRRARATEATHE